jgi:hypothetical protein
MKMRNVYCFDYTPPIALANTVMEEAQGIRQDVQGKTSENIRYAY